MFAQSFFPVSRARMYSLQQKIIMMSLKRICMGFPLLCQGIADLGASHELATFLCF